MTNIPTGVPTEIICADKHFHNGLPTPKSAIKKRDRREGTFFTAGRVIASGSGALGLIRHNYQGGREASATCLDPGAI